MVNVIIVLVLVVVCVCAIKSYAGKVAHGCCGGESDETKKIAVADKDPSHYPYSVKIQIEGMTCSRCKMKVENAFNSQDGMWAQADVKKGEALVWMKQPTEQAVLRRLVSKAGYHVTDMEEQQAS